MAGDDGTDRRLALIGFDNAIEIAVDAFIGLHPRLRGGRVITVLEREKALRNFHTRLEFVEAYVNDTGGDESFDPAVIIWYHQKRNELYHSGNGLIPDSYVVEGARDAARTVFRILFDSDPSTTKAVRTRCVRLSATAVRSSHRRARRSNSLLCRS